MDLSIKETYSGAVFGIVKEVLGFIRFSLRGEKNTENEWSLMCLAYSQKRMITYLLRRIRSNHPVN